MNLKQLETLRQDTAGRAANPRIGNKYVERLREIESDMQPLYSADASQFVSQVYRREYRAWKQGDRDEPLCTCQNPGCDLKNGTLPYQLRRRQSRLDTVQQTPDQQLEAYLKRHPGALVIDEAKTELRDLYSECSERLRKLRTDATHAIAKAEVWDVDDVEDAKKKYRERVQAALELDVEEVGT